MGIAESAARRSQRCRDLAALNSAIELRIHCAASIFHACTNPPGLYSVTQIEERATSPIRDTRVMCPGRRSSALRRRYVIILTGWDGGVICPASQGETM